MIPKRHRLTLNEEKYRELSKKGEVFHTKTLRIIVGRATNNGEARFAVLVPKKIDKRASRRNRSRRLLSTALFNRLPRIKKGRNVLVVCKKIFDQEKLEDVEPIVEEALTKAKIMKE